MQTLTEVVKYQNNLDQFSSYPASMDELDQVEQDIADQKVLADYRKRED